MKMHWWHHFKWGEVYEVTLTRQYTINGVNVGEPLDHVVSRQHGCCEKCGYVKERKL